MALPTQPCAHGGTAQAYPPNNPPRSCTDLWLAGERVNGVFSIQPLRSASFNVLCDFEAASGDQPPGLGAWTLVSSGSTYAPSDTRADTGSLASLTPSAEYDGVYSGHRDAVAASGGLADLRFTCTNDAALSVQGGMLVDLVVHDTEWYSIITARLDSESDMTNTGATAHGAPRRTNLLTGQTLAAGTPYANPLALESNAASGDFNIDFTDGGVSGTADATDWGRASGGPASMCGTVDAAGDATYYWHVWLRVRGVPCVCPAGWAGPYCATPAGHDVREPYPPCLAGSTDHDRDGRTPCVQCEHMSHAPSPGHTGPCNGCANGGVLHGVTGDCACPVGFAGRWCEVVDQHTPGSDCPAGTSDTDGDAATPCEVCGAGSHAPAGSVGPCSMLQCGPTNSDDDYDSATPCVLCPAGVGGTRGWAGPCPKHEMCDNGGVVTRESRSPLPRSCSDHWAMGARADGVYAIWTDGTDASNATGVSVWCDLTTSSATRGAHSNGWTLVSSSDGIPPSDLADPSPATLASTEPGGAPVYGTNDLSGGGWHRFWWKDAGAVVDTASHTDMLQQQYLDCVGDEAYCFQRLPSWLVEETTELLVVDSAGTSYK